MKGAVEQLGGTWAVFADPRANFDGKAACGSPETIHAVVENGREKADTESPKASMQTLHPKIAGARIYADTLEQTLRKP
ncbi:hypothetical protein [Streptomyces sp. HUAS TT20]|uniref:hypothetical protein n=1 Tax=Streptomyces sp. HUAS TT20 TaxID=3447509 RepID=UPI0021D9A469|nr:hypothetical protein [Streptomyces sp. HUAS 15-9]UXY32951.1 hypothetical protein N8I87_42305 [Streptomyces sp. HUAS 15-9]